VVGRLAELPATPIVREDADRRNLDGVAVQQRISYNIIPGGGISVICCAGAEVSRRIGEEPKCLPR
jgi:hypothetical protein